MTSAFLFSENLDRLGGLTCSPEMEKHMNTGLLAEGGLLFMPALRAVMAERNDFMMREG